MPKPIARKKGVERTISDEEMVRIRKEFKNLTPKGKQQAKELDEKIKELEATGMGKSCNELKVKLAHMVDKKRLRKESAGGEPKQDAYAPDVVAMAKKQSGE